jgi:signal transduction histidine kinase
MAVRGVRGRLVVALVALVALSGLVLGAGAYLFVDASLHRSMLDEASAQARFDLAVVAPGRLPSEPSRDDAAALVDALRLRGDLGTIIDLGDGDPIVSGIELAGALDAMPADLVARVASGELAYAWTTVGGRSSLVVAGRIQPSGPDLYFIHDASALDSALALLRTALLVGTLILIGLAVLTAGLVARSVLAPVDTAARTAERIESGDLGARIPVSSRDEFGRWADRFNRMAATLEETIERLRASQAQNRRFVADVSHELRTPLAALVAEASILRTHLDRLPEDGRRTAELLLQDVARLRQLVDDLMELSRFDAGAEVPTIVPVDVTALVTDVVARRCPAAVLHLPPAPLTVETDPRRIERVLGNLLDNANEHAPDTAVDVSLTSEAATGTVVLSVSDRGPGVAPEDLDRIFERFAKGDPSRRGGSSGLGLAIAREQADLLGGSLTASLPTAGGIAFQLRIPARPSVTAEPPTVPTGPNDAASIHGRARSG